MKETGKDLEGTVKEAAYWKSGVEEGTYGRNCERI